jgi:hypothetical protein
MKTLLGVAFMRIDVHTDPAIPGREPVARVVEAEVERALDALGAPLTRVDVELRDGPGDEKRCVIVAHAAERAPIEVSERAPNIRRAVAAAVRKVEQALATDPKRRRR